MKSTNGTGGLVKKLLGVAVSAALLLSLMPMAWAQSAQEKRYVALGDSISSGYGLNEGETSYTQQVAQANGLTLTNLAQDGETSASLMDKLQTDQATAAVAQADVITMTVGGNDLMNALYGYLTDQYNLANPDAPTTEEAMKAAVMGGDMGMLTFAMGVASGFANSERATQALAEFTTNLSQIVLGIHTANAQAQLVVVEQYNPYSYLAKELSKNPFFGSTAEHLSDAFGAGVMGINGVIAAVEEQLGYYSVAKVYEAFETAQENPCNASISMTMKVNPDFHPNAYGHTLIAQQVTGLLAHRAIVTPGEVVFEALDQGYQAADLTAQTVTVENVGTQALSQVQVTLAGEAPEGFVLTGAVPETLEAGESVAVAVTPREGLAAGTYSAQVMVQAQELEPMTCNVTFQVNSVPTYTLTVEQGSGSGAYAPGEVVTITAQEPRDGEHFAGWTVTQGQDGGLADAQKAQTTVVMPQQDVTLTATYEAHAMENGVCTVCGAVEAPVPTQTPAPEQTQEVPQDQEPPQTGDTSDLVIWVVLVCLTGGCLVAVTIWQNRRKKRDA